MNTQNNQTEIKESFFKEIQNGNPVTLRNAFIAIFVVVIITAIVLNHFHVINFSWLNKD